MNFQQLPHIPAFKWTVLVFFDLSLFSHPTNPLNHSCPHTCPRSFISKMILSSVDLVWAHSNRNISMYYRASYREHIERVSLSCDISRSSQMRDKFLLEESGVEDTGPVQCSPLGGGPSLVPSWRVCVCVCVNLQSAVG